MKRTKIDKIDRKILKRLQEDGRVTNVELAKSVGISAPPCLRRVRALEESGYIQSYHARIDHASMGYGVTIFASVKLKSQAEDDLRAFEGLLGDLSGVREVYLIAGDVDYLIKIVAKDWDSYQAIFTDALSRAPNVMSIKSSLAIKKPKHEAGVPIDV